MNVQRNMSLWTLAWPIYIELMLQFLLGTADTVMLSRISDDAVAVVGYASQLFNALITLFETVAGGAGILIAQKLGARRQEEARTIALMALQVTIGLGIALSLLLAVAPGMVAGWLHMPQSLMPLAEVYFSIVGGGMLLTAMMATLSTAIRNTGNTRGPMITAIGMNMLHLVLNYALIFGAFGFPHWGLTGAAVSTSVSRLLAVLMLLFLFRHSFDRSIGLKDMALFDRRLFAEVLRLGWPMGVSSFCWCYSQLVMYSFMAMLGPKELAARTYMNTLESFCYMLGFSVALAVQIQIAHLFGQGRMKEAYRSAFRALWIGLTIVMVNAALLYIFGRQVLGWFTSDPEIIVLGVTLLAWNLILQPGKMVNMTFFSSMNAVGDTRFTMIVSITSMWLVATLLSYWLGLRLHWGLVGIYIGMIADEYARGIAVWLRWRWKNPDRQAKVRHQASRLHV